MENIKIRKCGCGAIGCDRYTINHPYAEISYTKEQLVELRDKIGKFIFESPISKCCDTNANKALRRIGTEEYICEKCGKHCEVK